MPIHRILHSRVYQVTCLLFTCLVLLLLLSGCFPSTQALQTPTFSLASLTIPSIPTEKPTVEMMIPTVNPAVTQTLTPTFSPASLATVTLSLPARCPAVNGSYQPIMPQRSDHPSDLTKPILKALNSGASFASLNEAVEKVETPYRFPPVDGKEVPEYYTDRLSTIDLTADSVPEIIFRDDYWLAVFSCQDGVYKQVFDQIGGLPQQIKDLRVEDLNSDGLPEILFRLFDVSPINGQYFLYIYEWSGSDYQNIVIFNEWDDEDKEYPGALNHGHATNLSLEKNRKKGTIDVVVRGEVICGPCSTAGPWRKFTDVLTWNGVGFLHLPQRLDPPEYRFQALQDGDVEMLRGNYALAGQFYQQALNDKNLKGWSKKLYEQQEDIVRARGLSMPSPTPLPPDPNEYAVLYAYIRYRMMLLHAVDGDDENVRNEYQAFQKVVSPSDPGYDYLVLATTFWAAYDETMNLAVSCAKAREYADAHFEEIYTPIGDHWHGWQSPDYIHESQLICPFE